MKIHMLDDDLVSQIAAGEVVERPASVVKELVENALDAGAKTIDVKITQGGLEEIMVTDDGHGMEKEDAVLALKRHATSKISHTTDLYAIRTLGFRGEALPSIAAVTKLILKTATANSKEGSIVSAEGGQLISAEVCSHAKGTSVIVRELFFNTPARKKFLRSETRERALVAETLGRLALAQPRVAFRLISNNREILNTPGTGSLLDAITAVLGVKVTREVIPIEKTAGGTQVFGYVGKPGLFRSNRKQQIFFVNGRPIRSGYLSAAAEEALHGLGPAGRFPVLVINLRIDPELVDVNVHPTKQEVRFTKDSDVFLLVREAVRQAREHELGGLKPLSGGIAWPNYASYPRKAGYQITQPAEPQEFAFRGDTDKQLAIEFQETTERYNALATLDYWGTIPPTYLVFSGQGALFIMDQHAAHERIMYEKLLGLMEASGTQAVAAQTLQLNNLEWSAFCDYQEMVGSFGFHLEPFGGQTVIIKEVPTFVAPGQAKEMLLEILNRLAEDKPLAKKDCSRVLAATLACHRSVRAGQQLSAVEANKLLQELANTDQPFACPHGRPTFIRVSEDELKKRFGRI